MYKIVLSGGPCGGKSTAMSKLVETLKARGWFVFVVKETATELINNGIVPNITVELNKFQELAMEKQIAMENFYDKVAGYFNKEKTIILYDRGLGDNLAYVDKDVFVNILSQNGLTLRNAIDRYDMVLHLVTAADGAEENYEYNKLEFCNNKARSETPEEARDSDKKTLQAWVSAGCHKLKVIDNSTNFDGKIQRVISEIYQLIKEPSPHEIERKFLVKMPTDKEISEINAISKSNIIQTYLKSFSPEKERRIRQRGSKNTGYTFYLTEKEDISYGERLETERIINSSEYIELLAEADTSLHQISKERHCFVYNNQFFELDIYSFSKKYAILEIELSNITDTVEIPPFIEVVKEVTEDSSFRNGILAKTLSFDI